MNKLKFSSGMHLFIIITSIIIAVGLAMGLAFHFTSGTFFNWGGDYSSYRTVEVRYSVREIEEKEVMEACDAAFEENGVDYISYVTSGMSTESRIEYRFTASQDPDALAKAAEAINDEVGIASDRTGYATAYVDLNARFNSNKDIMYAGIAVAAVVVFQFIYFVIRYKLTMAAAAFIGDVHNLALFYALLAITRVQVASSVVALSVFVVVLTMIGCGLLFEKMRKSFRTDEFKEMSSFEQVDAASKAAFSTVTTLNAGILAAAAIMLVLTAIIGGTAFGLLMPCVCALIAAAVCEYGTMFFVPSVYSRLKQRADRYAAQKAVKYVGAKKTEKAEQQ